MRAFLLIIFLLSLFPLTSHSSTWMKGGAMSPGGYRDYHIYIPSSYYEPKNVMKFYPLIVMFHGCTQDANIFAAGTRMNMLAEKEGFIVLYPEQTYLVNKYVCWNWFFKQNQTTLTGEPSIANMMVEIVKNTIRIDRRRIYAVGFSAGGAMANIVASCFPHTFSAAAIYSGLEFKAADNMDDAFAATTDGGKISPEESGRKAYNCSLFKSNKPMSAIIFHDHDAKRMAGVHAEQVEQQFIAMNDYFDNGESDNSVDPRESIRTNLFDDPTKYPFDLYTNQLTNGALIKRYMVYNLDHAWSGGDGSLPFNDPKGPDATKLIWKFFKEVFERDLVREKKLKIK